MCIRDSLGTDQWGNVRNDTQIKVKKSGNSSPLADLKARPNSWNLSVDDSLDMDARDSYDPEGQSLKFDWMATNLDEVDLKIFDRSRAKAFFKRPGLYEFTVKITDEDGKFSNVNREAVVHGVNGFSGFGDPILKDYWVTENVGPRGNFSPTSWYSLDDVPGWLEIQVLDMKSMPLSASIANYPYIARKLPQQGDWAIQTKLRLVSRQFGSYDAGLMVLLGKGSNKNRYTIGFNDGTHLMVRKVNGQGNVTTLDTSLIAQDEIAVRIIRHGDQLLFEWKVEDVWEQVHAESVGADISAIDGGMFVATDNDNEPQAIRVGFDYSILIDPSAVSPLKGSIRVSEIMYNLSLIHI